MIKQQTVFLEPKTQAFIDAVNAPGGAPLYKLSYPDARKLLEDAQAGPIDAPAADIEDRDLATGPGGKVSVRIFRPQGAKGALPAVMYFHGGGWILGSKQTHDRLLRDLTAATGAAFVFVNYTPSPDAQFPVPIEQAYAATKYVAEHAEEFNLKAAKLALCGDSVGGNMTAAVTLLAKERGGPALRYQVMFYPVTDASLNTESSHQFAEGPWLTRGAMQWMWDAYAPNHADRKQIVASPLLATAEQLRGLPPALLITDENDILRDEGEAYARNLALAGVRVTAVRFVSTFHDFVMLNGLAETPATRGAILLASAELREALAK